MIEINRMKMIESPLFKAILDNTVASTENLLNNGENPNTPQDGFSPLQVAVREGHIEIIRILIAAGANVNSGKEFPPIYEAVLSRNILIVKALIEAGAELNQPIDEDDNTILLEAISVDNFEIVKLLVESGANPNVEGESGTPLLVAVEEGNLGVYEFLYSKVTNDEIKRIADEHFLKYFPSALEKREKSNKLVESFVSAADEGKLKKVKEYITSGVNVNAINYEGESALINAAACGHINVVKALLQAKANPDIFCLNKDGTFKTTALMELPMAHWNKKRIEIIQELINYGASINLKDSYGRTALMFFLDWNDSLDEQYEAIKLLLSNGAEVNVKDVDGFTVMMKARAKKLDKIMAFLGLYGAK